MYFSVSVSGIVYSFYTLDSTNIILRNHGNLSIMAEGDYLFGGIPIEIALRRMIIIIGIIESEAKAPTKNVILNM
jgi:hypothetical protein